MMRSARATVRSQKSLLVAAVALTFSYCCFGIPLIVSHTDGFVQPGTGAAIVVNFDVAVDSGASTMMVDALSSARSSNAQAIVIQMNTPGGLLSDMTNIIATIEAANQSGIPTYTYVPPNSLAASAGSYIAMASNKILMGPGSEIGPSTPIVEGGTPLDQNHTEGAMLSLMTTKGTTRPSN